MEKSNVYSLDFYFWYYSCIISAINTIIMKKTLVLFLMILSTVTLFSQGREDNVAYKSGESLEFRIRYGIFNTSYATLNLKETEVNGKKVFHAVGKGKTTGLARLFFKVDDTYESYFDTQEVKPYIFIRDIYEGGYTKKLKAYFHHSNNTAIVYNLENDERKEVTTPQGIQDVISAFYYLRNQPELMHVKEGDEVMIDMLLDNDEIFKFKLKFIGREKLDTNFGEINTMIFRPLVQDGRVFKEQESVTLWITEDENKIPVQIKADLRVGSLTAELVNFGGLKYPTVLKK